MSVFALTMLVFLGTSGCSRDGGSEAETAATTTSQDSTTEASTESTEASTTIDDSSEMMSTETDTDDGADDPITSGGSFYAGPEVDFGSPSECDPFVQDCPEGEKCVPYGSTGGTWDANKCVAIAGEGEPGEACTYGGAFRATDTCDGDSVCWNVVEVDGELVGTCTAFCTGTPDDPKCSEEAVCVIANQGSVTLCMPGCDPLAQDCPEGFGCHWVGDVFACLQDTNQPPNPPCDLFGECPAGSTCVLAELVPECGAASCCTAFCSISEPTCEEPNSECVPFFEDPPAGYEDVGICAVP